MIPVEIRHIVGLPEEDARLELARLQYGFRVVFRDGEYLPVTADLVGRRVNARVDAGVVTAIVGMG